MKSTNKQIVVIFCISLMLLASLQPVSFAVAHTGTISVPETNATPLSLKRAAIAYVDIINGGSFDQAMLDVVNSTLQDSIAHDFYDEYHVKSEFCISKDRTAITDLQLTDAYSNESSPDHQSAVSAVVLLLQSDRRLAEIELSDASNFTGKVPSLTRSSMELNIQSGQSDIVSAENYLHNGDAAQAVSLYGQAWQKGDNALTWADCVLSPVINITVPQNGTITSQLEITVSGVVDDPFVYTIPNVTVQANGRTYLPMLTNGMYSQQVQLAEGANQITVTVRDLYWNTGTAMATVMGETVPADTIPPALQVMELTDNPTLANPVYRLNGTVEPGATLVINNGTVAHNGTFEYSCNLSPGTNTIVVLATDSAGNMARWNKTRLIDSDMLPDYYEINVTGSDPLDGDSDSLLTVVNEAGNRTTDDLEDFDHDLLTNYYEYLMGTDPFDGDVDGDGMLDGYGQNSTGGALPLFVKCRIGADPGKVDTDDDGLSDEFELMRMGLLTNVGTDDSDHDGIPDADEDIDNDSLSNGEEMTYYTDPIERDTDGDTLTDGFEVKVSHTNPLVRDSDGDGLDDDSEVRLGTDPNVADSNNNGVPDGSETYTTTAVDEALGVSFAVTGEGDLSKQVVFGREYSEYYTNLSFNGTPAFVAPMVNISVNGTFDNATITMKYDPDIVSDPANFSLCYYNESLGLMVPVPSTYDAVNHTISANVTHCSWWTIGNVDVLSSIYTAVNNFNREIESVMSGAQNYAKNVVDTATGWFVDRSYTVDPGTGSVQVTETVKPNVDDSSSSSSSMPTPSATPVPTPVPDSLVHITFSENGQTNWFGNEASFPAGRYMIYASGWYTHWNPAPSIEMCIDQDLDPCADGGSGIPVRMPAWSSRGQNYPKNLPFTDENRLGMRVSYGSSDDPVYKLRLEPGILVFNHSGGKIGIYDKDETSYYADNHVNATYVLSFIGGSTPAVPSTDTDGDGLPDFVEMHGFMGPQSDRQYRVYYTDPNKADTDGDGLSDGFEAGTWTVTNGMKYFQLRSNPMLKDSDVDWLPDNIEFTCGSNPLSIDTDGDLIVDSLDEQPTYSNLNYEERNVLKCLAAVSMGFAFGEDGLPGGKFDFIVGDVSYSKYYSLGLVTGAHSQSIVGDFQKAFKIS